jgi:diguanylate cyclase (GGDEF)-like protein
VIRASSFPSFKNRLLILMVALVVLAQGATLLLVLTRVYRDTRAQSEHELRSAQGVLEHQLELRQGRLAATAQVLIADFGFKAAVASADAATIRSALSNHARRVGADIALMFGADGHLVASTSTIEPSAAEALVRPTLRDTDQPQVDSFVAVLNGHALQFVLTPVRAPEPIAWVAFGYVMDEAEARSLGSLVDLDVTFELPTALVASPAVPERSAGATPLPPVLITRVADQQFLTLRAPLPSRIGAIDLVLQRPMQQVMASYTKIRGELLTISALALACAIALALRVGGSAARPVEVLALAAQRIEAGQYDQPVQLRGGTEFVRLAQTFNGMQIGLREREERIRHQASHDPLTGLPNRLGMRERLAQLLEQNVAVTVLLLDLHRFRDLNASLDGETADRLLCAVANRIGAEFGARHYLARISADQFALLFHTGDARVAEAAAVAIAAQLRQGITAGELRVVLIVRGGISSVSAGGARTADDLLRQADSALLEAKERGVTVVFYEAGRDAEHRRGVLLMAELRRAISNNKLSLAYQPIVDMKTGTVHHLEALVRWTHPSLGVISPAEFVPLAERAAVITDLTHWVIGAACEQLQQWQRCQYRARVAINLSAGDVTDASLPAYIFRSVSEAGLEAEQLLFEVTESAIMREPQSAVPVMQQLRAAGSRFAIDDFGTGHSSLAQLHTLPVDELKIDRTFVRDLGSSERSLLIVRATTDLGHGLGQEIVAEGVETAEAWSTLLRLGCDYAQGYLVSRPIAAAELLSWVQARQGRLAAAVLRATETGSLIDLQQRRG